MLLREAVPSTDCREGTGPNRELGREIKDQIKAGEYSGGGSNGSSSVPGTRHCLQSIDCNSFPGLKRTALPGGIDTSAPVRGLRPMPVLRGRTLNTPNPRNSIRLPWASAFFIFSNTVSTAISDFVFVMPVLLTTSLIMSSLIKNAPSLSTR